MTARFRSHTRFGFAMLVVAAAAIGAASAAVVAHAGARANHITVTEREYHLTLSRRTYSPGSVTFVVLNRGKIAHSLAIHGRGLSRRIRGTIPAGGRRTLVVHLSGGTYTVWCPVGNHAALGMKTSIHASSGTSSGTSTGSGGGGWG